MTRVEQVLLSYRVSKGDSGSSPEIRRDDLVVERGEPLRREIEDFLGAVSEGRAPRVGGEDGLRALELARRIVDAMASPGDPGASK